MNLARKVTIMRLSILSLLLVTAASTTAATAMVADPQPQLEAESSERREAREPRSEPSPRAEREYRADAAESRQRMPERVQRAERAERAERVERTERNERTERAERIEPRAAAPEPVRDVARAAIAQERGEGWSRRSGDRTSGQNWREERSERRARTRDLPPTAGSPVFGSAVPTPGTVTQQSRDVSPGSVAAGGLRDRIAAEGLRRDRIERDNWRREWREDRRYDWRRHRDRDRSRFHLGIYVDPFGWRYRDWDIGWRLPSRYYASRYWIYDPWYYRLPPVSGYYRWIRYHDDVLLVDLRSGRVLDRIRNFFW